MSESQVNVNFKGQDVVRAGFAYDCAIRGLDSSFWKTLAATVAAAGTKVRLSSGGSLASYTQIRYGKVVFALNVPTTPSAGEAKKWGLLLPSAPTVGSMYFEIVGAVFRAVSYDDNGVAQTTVLTWDGEGAETLFEIEWENGYVIFKLNGDVVATHQTRVGQIALPLYLINSDGDNTDLGYILIKETAQYV